jgi:hypothetical protein
MMQAHISDVVSDVVSNDGRVARVVLGDIFDHLAGEIGANIGSLSVDPTSDPPEERNRRTTQAETGHTLEHELARLALCPVKAERVHVADQVQREETDAAEREPHD